MFTHLQKHTVTVGKTTTPAGSLRKRIEDAAFEAIMQWADATNASADMTCNMVARADQIITRIPSVTDDAQLYRFLHAAEASLEREREYDETAPKTVVLKIVVDALRDALPPEELPPMPEVKTQPLPPVTENQDKPIIPITPENEAKFHTLTNVVMNSSTQWCSDARREIVRALEDPSKIQSRYADGSVDVKIDGDLTLRIKPSRENTILSIAEPSIKSLDGWLMEQRKARYNEVSSLRHGFAGRRAPDGETTLRDEFVESGFAAGEPRTSTRGR